MPWSKGFAINTTPAKPNKIPASFNSVVDSSLRAIADNTNVNKGIEPLSAPAIPEFYKAVPFAKNRKCITVDRMAITIK